jgi:transmembrane sensor
MNRDIKELLVRFAEGKSTEEERREVLRYFQQQGKAEDMPSVEEILEAIGHKSPLDQTSADRIYQQIIGEHKAERKVRRLAPFGASLLRYAAAVALIATVSAVIFLLQNRGSAPFEHAHIPVRDSARVLRPSDITLELADGRVEVIDPDANRMIRAADGSVLGHQEKDQLAYHGTKTSYAGLEYNTIRVAYGKRFRLLLSDGTTVHLNSGTTLRFPVRFLDESQKREVFLEGEAYFEVARNEGQPFIVDTGDMKIRVLGTKFNVSTYPDDRATDVVLVEGRVQLDAKDDASRESHILEPGFKASFDRLQNKIVTREVPTTTYTSWIKGELVFRNMTFEDILKKLERRYNVTIENRNTKLAGERFNANFGDEPIENVLRGLKTAYEIEFEIDDNHVIIW